MKALICGSRGQLGRELLELSDDSFVAVGYDVDELDITDADAVTACVNSIAPDIVINAAAYTAVDKAESERDLAFAINRDGPANLAAACAAAGIPLIHVSTDFVFSGEHNRPWVETDPVDPKNVYGESKLAGEEAVRELLPQHVILRTAWVYSQHGHNFVKTMLKLGLTRDEISVVDDQVGCPTAARDLAAAITCIAQAIAGGSERWGTWHFAGAGQTSWHGLAQAVLNWQSELTGKQPKLHAIPSSAYTTAADRPAWSVLDCSQIQSDWQVEVPAWTAALAIVLEQLEGYAVKGDDQ